MRLVIRDDRVAGILRASGTIVYPGARILDTANHTCAAITGTPDAGACEGCHAESYLLDWLVEKVDGIDAQIGRIPGAT